MWRIIAAAVAFLLFGTGAARAEWRRAESPNFILYGDLSESALRQRILLLEDFDRLLRTLTAGEEEPAPNRLHVYVFSGPAPLRIVRPGLPPAIAGFYAASDDGILAMIDGEQRGRERDPAPRICASFHAAELHPALSRLVR